MNKSFPKNTPRYLKPFLVQVKPSGRLGSPSDQFPTSIATLFNQFTFADDTPLKSSNIFNIIFMSFWPLTSTATSSAYADSLKTCSQFGIPTTSKSFLNLTKRGSIAKEYSIPDKAHPCLTPL